MKGILRGIRCILNKEYLEYTPNIVSYRDIHIDVDIDLGDTTTVTWGIIRCARRVTGFML